MFLLLLGSAALAATVTLTPDEALALGLPDRLAHGLSVTIDGEQGHIEGVIQPGDGRPAAARHADEDRLRVLLAALHGLHWQPGGPVPPLAPGGALGDAAPGVRQWTLRLTTPGPHGPRVVSDAIVRDVPPPLEARAEQATRPAPRDAVDDALAAARAGCAARVTALGGEGGMVYQYDASGRVRTDWSWGPETHAQRTREVDGRRIVEIFAGDRLVRTDEGPVPAGDEAVWVTTVYDLPVETTFRWADGRLVEEEDRSAREPDFRELRRHRFEGDRYLGTDTLLYRGDALVDASALEREVVRVPDGRILRVEDWRDGFVHSELLDATGRTAFAEQRSPGGREALTSATWRCPGDPVHDRGPVEVETRPLGFELADTSPVPDRAPTLPDGAACFVGLGQLSGAQAAAFVAVDHCDGAARDAVLAWADDVALPERSRSTWWWLYADTDGLTPLHGDAWIPGADREDRPLRVPGEGPRTTCRIAALQDGVEPVGLSVSPDCPVEHVEALAASGALASLERRTVGGVEVPVLPRTWTRTFVPKKRRGRAQLAGWHPGALPAHDREPSVDDLVDGCHAPAVVDADGFVLAVLPAPCLRRVDLHPASVLRPDAPADGPAAPVEERSVQRALALTLRRRWATADGARRVYAGSVDVGEPTPEAPAGFSPSREALPADRVACFVDPADWSEGRLGADGSLDIDPGEATTPLLLSAPADAPFSQVTALLSQRVGPVALRLSTTDAEGRVGAWPLVPAESHGQDGFPEPCRRAWDAEGSPPYGPVPAGRVEHGVSATVAPADDATVADIVALAIRAAGPLGQGSLWLELPRPPRHARPVQADAPMEGAVVGGVLGGVVGGEVGLGEVVGGRRPERPLSELVVTARPAPRWPRAATLLGLEATTCTYELAVSAGGRPAVVGVDDACPRVLRPLGEDALRDWRFEPPGGRGVRTTVELRHAP